MSAHPASTVTGLAGRGMLGIARTEWSAEPHAKQETQRAFARRLSQQGARLCAELELNDCAHIDDAALYWLLGLTGLDSLSLAGCVRVTDIGMCLLGSKVTGLRRLDLSGCHEVRGRRPWQDISL